MRHARSVEVGQLIAARAIGAFGEGHMDVRLFEPVEDRRARERGARTPEQRVGHAATTWSVSVAGRESLQSKRARR